MVLRKPGKTVEQQQTAGAYRPVSLLSALGKVIETAIGQRIAEAAESQQLLPETQMGNRPHRSTELAVRMVVDIAHTAWSQGAVASLLQLDIQGAYDCVNHTRLLHTMQRQGFPMWTIRWIASYLTDRTARLHFDGQTTEPRKLATGSPQGSPLSPILWLLYTASLFEELKAIGGLVTIGFSDDLNLLAVGKTTLITRSHLEAAWPICQRWAHARGLKFAPGKSELMHLTRHHAAETTPVRLGDLVIQPTQEARFLGIWLDRKLKWKGHLAAIKRKFATQQFALTRLTASVWGCDLLRAREVYTKVIRSAIAYGAGVWHQLADQPKGIAVKIAPYQSKCLRVVSGAYKATPVRLLESEVAIPPIDIYLNRRVADFEARLERSGMATLLQLVCSEVATKLRARRHRKCSASPAPSTSLEYGKGRAKWASEWAGDQRASKRLFKQWQARWQHQDSAAEQQAGHRRYPRAPAALPELLAKPLKKHIGLSKHESSLLVQIRIGKVGLRAFLFERKVPDIASPHCRCGLAAEMPAHVVIACPELSVQREVLRSQLNPFSLQTSQDFANATLDHRKAIKVVRWLLGSGRFREFRLAEHYRAEGVG